VNLSYGLEPDEEDRTLPVLSAATRLYRADTSRLLMSREDMLSDKTSSSTLSEFRATPGELTDRLYAMATPLGAQVAASLVSTLRLTPPAAPIYTPPAAPEATFINGQPATGEPAPLAPPVSIEISTPAAPAPESAPPEVAPSTPLAPAGPAGPADP